MNMVESVMYMTGSFNDWLGQEHKFVVAAVTVLHEDEMMLGTVENNLQGKYLIPVKEYNGDGHLQKSVFIGVSVCCPLDKFNEEIGQKIAYNRAITGKRPQAWISSNIGGMLGPKVVKALLQQEVDHIAAYPGSVIPGYNESKAKYEAKLSAQQQYEALPTPEKEIVLAAINGCDLSKLIALADTLKGTLPALGAAMPEPTNG